MCENFVDNINIVSLPIFVHYFSLSAGHMDRKMEKNLLRQPARHLVSIIDSLVQRFGADAVSIVGEKLAELQVCWIVKLPPDTFCTITNQWLTLKEVSYLDVAFCNTKLRSQFHDGLLRSLVTFSLSHARPTFDCHGYVRWITNRKIELNQLDMSQWNMSTESYVLLDLYLKSHGRSLLNVNMSKCQRIPPAVIHTIFTHCRDIQILSFQSCEGIPASLVELALSGCGQLTQLLLSDAKAADGDLWPKISQLNIAARNIQCLDLGGHADLTDAALTAIIAACGVLRRLSVRRCTGLTARAFDAIGARCPHLEHLIATDTALQDSHMLDIIHHAPRMHSLCINGCAGITELSIEALLTHTRLICLEIAHNPHLSDEHMTRMHTSFPALQLLQVDNCTSLTPAGVLSVTQHCAVLSVLSAKLFPPHFDEMVRRGIIEGKHWLGKWKDRRLTVYLSTE